MNSSDLRHNSLRQWLTSILKVPFSLQPMAPGAGLRRYFRVAVANNHFVVMDAPGAEKCAAFIELAQAFGLLGVQVPVIHAADMQQGFLLLTDFGQVTYGECLNPANADELYQQAFSALLRIQSYPQTGNYPLPLFDMVHYREKMGWFIEFYLRSMLNFPLTIQQQMDCERLFDLLIATAQQQPKTGVHYDFHCRNLMKLPNAQTGVLDFQDAVYGPVTYDLMSLLRDCYVDWPAPQVQKWMQQYQQAALSAGILTQEDPDLWMRWCDFSSAQRHIKCIGLFARFHVLGHSADYLVYIPRLLNYLREIAARYPEMARFHDLLEKIPV